VALEELDDDFEEDFDELLELELLDDLLDDDLLELLDDFELEDLELELLPAVPDELELDSASQVPTTSTALPLTVQLIVLPDNLLRCPLLVIVNPVLSTSYPLVHNVEWFVIVKLPRASVGDIAAPRTTIR
jgi:hypothetical protein